MSNKELDELSKEIDAQIAELSIEDIKTKLRKKATCFKTGGIRPTNALGESWIGKVGWQLSDETWPEDENGNKMIPLATIFLEGLDYVPDALKNIKLITIYLDGKWRNSLVHTDHFNKNFIIKTYESLTGIVSCNYTSEIIKSFPLVPYTISNDFPMWDDVDEDMIEIICQMEKDSGIEYYNDIFEENDINHKIGGHPSVIQGGLGYNDGFEYVLQIASDEKANFNIIDGGNFYFGYNSQTEEWDVRCDFY